MTEYYNDLEKNIPDPFHMHRDISMWSDKSKKFVIFVKLIILQIINHIGMKHVQPTRFVFKLFTANKILIQLNAAPNKGHQGHQ